MTRIDPDYIVDLLSDEGQFSYLDVLLRCSSDASASAGGVDPKIINTLELFSFGDYNHYLKYREQYVELNSTQLLKLVKLTIISIVNDLESHSIPLDDILHTKYNLAHAVSDCISDGKAISPVNAPLSSRNQLSLEQIIISMKYAGHIDVKIDEFKQTLNVYGAKTLRDAYDSRQYKLRVLNEQHDIPRRSFQGAVDHIQTWLNEKVTPLTNEHKNTPQNMASAEFDAKLDTTPAPSD